MLFLHGILGTPRHFDFLLPLVPEDWSIWTLLLPGHGGKCKDFSRTSMVEWKAAVEKALAELSESHRRVYIVGHSMGTLLAVHAVNRSPGKVCGIFALAMPLKIGYTLRAAISTLRLAYCSPENDDELLRAMREAGSISLSKNPFAYLGWIPRFLELFALSREIRGIMPALSIPCTAVQSALDEMVSSASLKYMGRAKAITLQHSSHFYYSQEDMEIIKTQFKKFIAM